MVCSVADPPARDSIRNSSERVCSNGDTKVYVPSMVGNEDEGVQDEAHHAVEGPVVREAPVTTANIIAKP
jgi:hypothetical protein